MSTESKSWMTFANGPAAKAGSCRKERSAHGSSVATALATECAPRSAAETAKATSLRPSARAPREPYYPLSVLLALLSATFPQDLHGSTLCMAGEIGHKRMLEVVEVRVFDADCFGVRVAFERNVLVFGQ